MGRKRKRKSQRVAENGEKLQKNEIQMTKKQSKSG